MSDPMFFGPPNMDYLNPNLYNPFNTLTLRNPFRGLFGSPRFPPGGGPPYGGGGGGGYGGGRPFPMYGKASHYDYYRKSYKGLGMRRRRGGGGRGYGGGRRSGGYRGRSGTKGPERKFVDTNYSQTQTTDSTLILLSTIPQGITESQRLGREAAITTIQFTNRAVATTLATDVDQMWVRRKLWVVQDMQPNGAAMATTDFLSTDHIDSYRNLDNLARFKVLFHRSDNFVPLAAGNGTNTDSAQVAIFFKANIKCCIKMEFGDANANGAIDTMERNSVYLLTMIDEGASARNLFFQGRLRIRFVG